MAHNRCEDSVMAVHLQCGGCECQRASVRHVATLQAVTIGWMLVECGGSGLAAARAHSLPLAAFGSDSLVELLSACIVLLQFRRGIRISALAAARLASVLLVLLAGMVVVLAILMARFKIVPERSFLGIGITLGALIVMPILAFLKRRYANRTSNHALAADAVQSATCAYLAAITLLSLVLQTIHAAWWIDSAAALCLIPILLIEARRAWRAEACGCC
jgi:divalent metal cation (Fe/Co/Zn/Cd) transporter